MNPVSMYEFTLKSESINRSDLTDWLKEWANKWVFQRELSETGYDHYQGCFSLFKKKRKADLVKVLPNKNMSVRPMSTNATAQGRFNYFMKADTRTEGPWKDTDEEIIIPWHIDHVKTLYPWQQTLKDLATTRDARSIHAIVDNIGNNGKSTFKTYMRCNKLARVIPFANDYKDLMRMVCDMPTDTCYIIDMPRAINKERLSNFWSAIESIKDGYAYDDRYSFKEKIFGSPQIFVFMNTQPEQSYLSSDRWKLWKIDNLELRNFF